MVRSWLMHSTVPSISHSSLWIDSAHDIWVDLHDWFSPKNAPRIFKIRRTLSTHVQGNDSISAYYTIVKGLCDELLSYCTLPACSCGAMTTLQSFLETDHLLDFLQGLNDSYAAVRSQILLMDPLPSINKAYSLLLQEERQRSLRDVHTALPDQAAMAVTASSLDRRSGSSSSTKPSYYCTFYNKNGHTESRCFKKNGYPDW
ncbi:uncharacterized protein LOC122665551 [Telopea speciosissima]|uniref:uncharacterized protein LOC122665551 n=1 Tax=Telopea speciosissima TaxID=54955 RepID=UPI001CC7D207|nr:uncharacterized protein LOC122665551 [Telopea speciosissima]